MCKPGNPAEPEDAVRSVKVTEFFQLKAWTFRHLNPNDFRHEMERLMRMEKDLFTGLTLQVFQWSFTQWTDAPYRIRAIFRQACGCDLLVIFEV